MALVFQPTLSRGPRASADAAERLPRTSVGWVNPVTGLSLGRIAVGAISFARPGLAAKMFGLDAANNPQGAYLARLFGSREIALGTATLLARGSTRRNLVLAGIGVDVADAATGVLGIQDKTVPVRTGTMLIGPALGAVLSGVAGLRTRAS